MGTQTISIPEFIRSLGKSISIWSRLVTDRRGIILQLIRDNSKLMTTIMQRLGIRPTHRPPITRTFENGMVRLRPSTALQLIILPLAIRTLQKFEIHLERLLTHILAPHQQLHALDVIRDGNGTHGLISLGVELGGGLPDLVEDGLTLLATFGSHDVDTHKGGEGLIVGSADFEGLGTGGIGVLELDAAAVGGFGTVHAGNVHEMNTTDGSQPKFHTGLERSPM
mmetsp:Transcript_37037/g.66669  ORF Transcript_37037/g.66669 Transcript_37037/m.66669 type:complete len:224 (+) Transcript_37037:383-1054(+)